MPLKELVARPLNFLRMQEVAYLALGDDGYGSLRYGPFVRSDNTHLCVIDRARR
jgi:hypothetical protein